MVNIVGYGLLSPLAGWLLVHTEPTRRTLPALLLLACWIGGTYFGAQAFQGEEDRQRGYRTLVATHGASAAVRLARWGFAVGLWGAVALAALGWFPRALAVALIPWLLLDRHLARWQAEGEVADGALRARKMLRGGVLVAVTVIAAVTVQHVVVLLDGGQPAGLGTAWSPWP
jgi:4-hydroxybenzoate polyprenyltransferase